MKKLLSIILTIVLLFSIAGSYTNTQTISVNAAEKSKNTWPTAPKIFGETGVLIEASTGTVLYDKKANKKMYPASITKIMTALLTIENCKLDDKVTFSENAINSIHYDDAHFGCQIGEKMSIKDCLYVLMLKSANEVATALGEHIAGSTKKFAEMMNERAKQAGALGTHFTNANGLHNPDHYVTAYDMAMITRDAIQYPLFREIVNTTSYKVSKNNKRKTEDIAYQKHQMVWPTSSHYYKGIIGGKTGYTDQSRTTLVTCAERNGITLIAVVLRSNKANVYNDTKALFDYGFNNFNLLNVSKNDSRFTKGSTPDLQPPFSTHISSIYIDKDSNVIIPKNTDFTKLTSTVDFNLSEDSFGTITYKLGKRTVGTAALKYENTDLNADSNNKTTEVTTNSDSNNINDETTKNDKIEKISSEKKKIKIKFSKTFLIIIVVIIAVIVIMILTMLHRRKLNRIRNQKRRRNR